MAKEIKNKNLNASHQAACALYDGIIAVTDEYKAAVGEFESNYTGAMLVKMVDEAREAERVQIEALREKYLPEIIGGIERARAEVDAAALRPVPSDVAELISSMEGVEMSRRMREVVRGKVAPYYLAKVRAYNLFDLGKDDPEGGDGIPSLDYVVDALEVLSQEAEKAVGEIIVSPFAVAVFLDSGFVSASEVAEAFLDTYAEGRGVDLG